MCRAATLTQILDDLQLTNRERALAADYVQLRESSRAERLRRPLRTTRVRLAYARANPYPFGRLEGDRRLGDIGRYVSERFYGFAVGKFAYRYEQFWYRGVNLESIGAFTSLAPEITITGMNHPLDYVTTSPIVYLEARGFVDQDVPERMNPRKNNRVRIGNDVWIGQNVTILPGVSIGDGAVVGAGSVLTRDIPPYAIVAGNPAQVLRRRFDEETAAKLLEIRWWDWEDRLIRERLDLLVDPTRLLAELYEPSRAGR